MEPLPLWTGAKISSYLGERYDKSRSSADALCVNACLQNASSLAIERGMPYYS